MPYPSLPNQNLTPRLNIIKTALNLSRFDTVSQFPLFVDKAGVHIGGGALCGLELSSLLRLCCKSGERDNQRERT